MKFWLANLLVMEKLQLEGSKVILRPFEKSDYLDVYNNIQDKKIALYVGTPYPYSEIEAKKFVDVAMKHWITNEAKQFAIIDKASGKFAGAIGLMFKRKDGPLAEIGYWMGTQFRGNGLMTESVKLLIKHGFEKEGLEKIYGRAYLPNRSSARIFEKLGFLLEGRMRKQIYREGFVFDVNFYGLLKSEFFGAKSNLI